MDTKEILFALTKCSGVSGEENEVCAEAGKILSGFMNVKTDRMNNLIAEKKGSGKHFLLDAHTDKIGLIVTGINPRGFIKFDRCGGADPRVTVGSEVTVLGEEPLFGVVCSVPPHLANGEGKLPAFKDMAIDVGLSYEEAQKLVTPGDRIVYKGESVCLLGDRIASPGLDNRAGVTAVIRCAEMLEEKNFSGNLTVLLSSREEINSAGAKTASFSNPADEAIVIDTTFGISPGVGKDEGGELGKGALVGFSPVLDRKMSENLIRTAEKLDIPCSREVMGRATGTTADHISVAAGGIPTATVSIPIKNMHTQVETVCISDIENTARLVAEYILSQEGESDD